MVKDFKSMTKKELVAYLELRENLPQANSPNKVADFLIKEYGKKQQEYFLVILLDSSLHPFRTVLVSIGLVNRTLVHPREVFAPSIEHRAAYIILAHNHPSGDLTPSEEDIATTDRIVKAGKIIGINVLEHIIFTDKGYYSMREDNATLFN